MLFVGAITDVTFTTRVGPGAPTRAGELAHQRLRAEHSSAGRVRAPAPTCALPLITSSVCLRAPAKNHCAAGIASRRAAEKLITGGAVSVNGQVVTELGTKADLDHDHIRVNGKLLHGPERHIYLLMNKPRDTSQRSMILKAGPRSWIFFADSDASLSCRTARLCERGLAVADE